MPMPRLDARLGAALELMGVCPLAADIGADHGRLSLHLLSTGASRKVYVCDISPLALQKARGLMTRWGLDGRAEFIAADGLSALPGPVDAAAILGMGGDTIQSILRGGADRLKGASLVLSPQTMLMETRLFLSTITYAIREERLVRAAGRFYVVIKAAPGDCGITEKEALIGPCLMKDRPVFYADYLNWRRQVLSGHLAAALKAGDTRRGRVLARQIAYIKEESL